jgi:(p)ppGpp synthase/HD superfamily hydrolase
MPSTNILKRAERDEHLKIALEFLRARGAWERDHSGSSLAAHLMGTAQILLTWKHRKFIWMAGLFHSVYGTKGVARLARFEERQLISELIGPSAEELVHLFSQTRMSSLIKQKALISESCSTVDHCLELHAANLVEQLSRVTLSPADMRQQRRRFVASLPSLSTRAARDVSRALHIV